MAPGTMSTGHVVLGRKRKTDWKGRKPHVYKQGCLTELLSIRTTFRCSIICGGFSGSVTIVRFPHFLK